MNPLAVDKPQTQAGNVPLLVLLHAAFVLTGVICTMLGPLLPVLSARWALDDTHASLWCFRHLHRPDR